jgi:hypothetical protein
VLEQQIRDLVSVLQAMLPPSQFDLVWALLDAVEQLGMVDASLRERRLMDSVARHWPMHDRGACATLDHLVKNAVIADDHPYPDHYGFKSRD